MGEDAEQLLREQIAYYRARAGEYDEWFLRQGRYDRGPELRTQWFAEVAQVERALAAFAPRGRVLELAGGMGLWTQRLAPHAARLMVVDSSPEALALNAERVPAPHITRVVADLFTWRPAASEPRFDVVFFGFWLSHVPPERFDSFWRLVRDCLAPGGRVFFVDSRYDATSTARDHTLDGPTATTVTRRLNAGQTFRIVKVFYRPDELEARLAQLGWRIQVSATERYFLYGSGALS